MSAKKVVEQPKLREYMFVEDINRELLGVLQFKHDLKIYTDSAGRLVVERAEYEKAIAQQGNR